MGHLSQRLQPEPRRLRWIAAVAVMVLALAGGGLWLIFAASVGGQPAASGAAIARVEARTANVTVARGETVRLDLDVYNSSNQEITPTTQLIGWDVVHTGQDHARRAWVAVFFEARDAAKNPRTPLASIAGAPVSVHYTAPDRALVVGTTVTVRAVVAKADCAAGGSSTRRPHPPADWDGPCAADFTINIVAPATPTPTPTPTPTIVVQPTYTLTLTPPTNGALTANPGQAAYDKGDGVVVAATPKAGYRLAAWGGDCAGTAATSATCTLTMDADKTVSATFVAVTSAAPLRLTVFTSGSGDGEVILEWSGDAAGAKGWQYRLRGPVWQGVQYRRVGAGWETVTGRPWGEWTTIPGSTRTTTSYRVSGLRAAFGYDFEVRPVTANGAAAGATFERAVASKRGSDGIAYAYPATYLEAGKKFRIHRTAYTFTVPAEMKLVMGLITLNSDGTYTIGLWDAKSGSVVFVDADGGTYTRELATQTATQQSSQTSTPDSAATGGAVGASRNVEALFDSIESSIRREPEP